jgi:GABA(A) receptor-associated protein
MEEYKVRYSEEYRINEFKRINAKYPERIPIIVCKGKDCTLNDIDKIKYLVPNDMNIAQFIYIIRKRICMQDHEALFILVNNNLLPSNKLIKEIYDSNKDTDGFLYVIYTSENTFG